MTGPLLTARIVAELLDVTPATVLRWTRQGDLPAVRLPSGQIRYRPGELEDWLAGRSVSIGIGLGWRHEAAGRAREAILAVIRSQVLAYVVMNTSPTSRRPLPLRVPRPLIERIDNLRGLVPRETYVRDLLERAITAEERKAKKSRR